MRGRMNVLGSLVVLVGVWFAAAASAAPVVVYPELDPSGSNAVTVVQIVGQTSPCGFGVPGANCLANAPVAIDGANVTLDLGTNELLNLSMSATGPGNIVLNGFNGYQRIVFHDAAFQSSGTATLGAGGSFAISGAVTASSLEIFLAGNLSAIPDIVELNYTTGTSFNVASGTVVVSGDQATVSVVGIDLGTFPDPVNPSGGPAARVRANFAFVAAVPEPGAALLYGVGLLVAGATARRRAAPIRG